MKGLAKLAAVTVIGAVLGSGVPTLAGQDTYGHSYRSAYAGRNGYGTEEGRGRQSEPRSRWHEDDYSQRAAYSYAPRGTYGNAPAYDPYYGRTHHGRDAAITLGAAAAGALIGGAAGNARGAAIGAIVGGIAGAVASTAADHHGHEHGRW